MIDSYDRKINYMRISITDRCNLRCRYCMPYGIELMPMSEILTYENICDICKEAVELGITRFKITGGEPLVRKGCPDLIRMIKAIPGVEQVTMTTNGILLKEQLENLKNAGLDAINISLDSLDKERFHSITGFDQLEKVLDGIHLAVDYGFPVKINCVLQKGMNDEEWDKIAMLAKELPLDVRYIELMPIGDGHTEEGISNEELLSRFRHQYPSIEKDERIHGNGPAVYYKIPGWKGSIGLISAIHGKFCSQCNRIRMTSTGEIKPCLCFEESISIKEAAKSQDKSEMKKILKQAILRKPQMHRFEETDQITEQKKMAQIGG